MMQETQRSHSDSVDGRQKNMNMVMMMGKLKDSLMSRLAALNPSISINSFHASFIQQRLQQLFHSFHTPTHPPYALMIQRAMRELNEESGSTEEAISEFITREYEGLPWAHVRILDLHLRRLCMDGVIVRTTNGRYRPKKKGARGRKRRTAILKRCEGERGSGMHGQETKEQSALEEKGEVQWKQPPLLGVVELEQQSQSEFQGTGVAEEHNGADEYQGQMAKAQSEAEEQQTQETSTECTMHVFQMQGESMLMD